MYLYFISQNIFILLMAAFALANALSFLYLQVLAHRLKKGNILAKKDAYEKSKNDVITYSHIALALSADYTYLCYVDLDSEEYISYNSNPGDLAIDIQQKGNDFFHTSRENAKTLLYREDQPAFIDAFTKEKVIRDIDMQGTFTLTYRQMVDGVPTYVHMKAIYMDVDREHIVVGINNIDQQVRQQHTLDRMRAEEITYARITALSGDYICIYTVDPYTDHYEEYTASETFENLGLEKSGSNFFEQSRKDCVRIIFEEDQEKFLAIMTKDRILHEVVHNGFFSLKYRLMLNDIPTYVKLKAALVEEQDGAKPIIGISNIDLRIRQEQEYESMLKEIHNVFKRSPIFRIGGDEFVVIVQGYGYDMIDMLIEKMELRNKHSIETGDVVIACGMSRFENDKSIEHVLERADRNMYVNKQLLKEIRMA